MKISIDKANSRGYADHVWLKTYHTFSFSNYYNPNKISFGALRVLNDDTISPGKGFEMHPHKNMEVISIPLHGQLVHQDSLKNSHSITWGQIQIMSAGSGIYHSEYNGSQIENLQLLQIWVIPEQSYTSPKYEDYDITDKLLENEITTFIEPGNTISILQKAWFSWAILEKGITRKYQLKEKETGVYIFVINGEINIEGTMLSQRDGAEITDTREIDIISQSKSLALLIEVPLILK